MTHIITWDHGGCEHSADPEGHWCSPRGCVSCDDPAGNCRKYCRATGYTACEDGWSLCENECDGYDHPDPGVEHCTSGHVLDLGDECNAVLFIEEGPISNGPGGQRFTDGPILVEWTGDGYVWDYAVSVDIVPCEAVE